MSHTGWSESRLNAPFDSAQTPWELLRSSSLFHLRHLRAALDVGQCFGHLATIVMKFLGPEML